MTLIDIINYNYHYSAVSIVSTSIDVVTYDEEAMTPDIKEMIEYYIKSLPVPTVEDRILFTDRLRQLTKNLYSQFHDWYKPGYMPIEIELYNCELYGNKQACEELLKSVEYNMCNVIKLRFKTFLEELNEMQLLTEDEFVNCENWIKTPSDVHKITRKVGECLRLFTEAHNDNNKGFKIEGVYGVETNFNAKQFKSDVNFFRKTETYDGYADYIQNAASLSY